MYGMVFIINFLHSHFERLEYYQFTRQNEIKPYGMYGL